MFGSLAGLFGVNSHSPDNETDVKKEEPPDANPDASKAPLEPKSLHQAPFSGNSPVKYGSGPQQYCLVESRQSATGKHLETYVTCALADKGTNIPKELIQQACLSGGGMVRGVYFRFVDEKGQQLSKQVVSAIQHPLPANEALDICISKEEMTETTGTTKVTKSISETTIEATSEEKIKPVEDTIKPPSPGSSLVASMFENEADEPSENVESDEIVESDPPEEKAAAPSTKVTMMEADTISDNEEDTNVDMVGKKRPREDDTSLDMEDTVDGNTIGIEKMFPAPSAPSPAPAAPNPNRIPQQPVHPLDPDRAARMQANSRATAGLPPLVQPTATSATMVPPPIAASVPASQTEPSSRNATEPRDEDIVFAAPRTQRENNAQCTKLLHFCLEYVVEASKAGGKDKRPLMVDQAMSAFCLFGLDDDISKETFRLLDLKVDSYSYKEAAQAKGIQFFEKAWKNNTWVYKRLTWDIVRNKILKWFDNDLARSKRITDSKKTSARALGRNFVFPLVSTAIATGANEPSGFLQDEPQSLQTQKVEETFQTDVTNPFNVLQNDGKAEAILPRRIRALHLSTGEKETFASIEAAVLETRTNKSLIEQACLGGGGTADGKLYFSFDDEPQSGATSLPRKAAPPEEGGPIPPSTFDISTLLPVKRSSKKFPVRPPKIIELVDKGTNEVVCCFRGIARARQTLGIERSFVLKACSSYGTSLQPDLGTYILRYASNQDGPLLAYDYGAHKDDYKVVKETHQARLARWTRAMSNETRDSGGTSQTLPPTKKIKRSYQKKKDNAAASKKVTTKVPATAKQKLTPSTITIGEAAAAKEINLNGISVPPTITNNTDTSMICIMCQAQVANIVFEPCHHCVMCSRCSNMAAPTFCPTCRTTISDRIKPSSIRVVRPRVYSSYSFM